jgi:adenylylsulfate kinase-like enzyme
MKRQQVFVRISGQAATGKTCLGTALGRKLQAAGIPVEMWEADNSFQKISPEDLDLRLRVLSDKIEVIITTEQISSRVFE